MLKKSLATNQCVSLIRSPWFYSIWFLIAILSYINTDKAIAWAMHDHASGLVLLVANTITHLGSSDLIVGFLFLSVLLTQFVFKKTQLSQSLLFVLIAVVSAGLICDILKFILGRARPIELFSEGVYGFQFFKTHYAFISFPSGHSTAIAALGVSLSLVWPRYRYLCLTVILAVGLSRIILTAHYLSDVMAGLYLGAITSTLVQQYYVSLQTKILLPSWNKLTHLVTVRAMGKTPKK